MTALARFGAILFYPLLHTSIRKKEPLAIVLLKVLRTADSDRAELEPADGDWEILFFRHNFFALHFVLKYRVQRA